jgi:hypothetical protein
VAEQLERNHQAVKLLIGSRFDGLYLPPGALRTVSGFAPGATRPCPNCGHTATPGWITDAFKRRRPCAACGGAGGPSGKGGQWVAKDAGSGRVAYDPMDTKEAAVGSTSTFATARPRKTVKCDSCGGEGAYPNGHRCTVCGGSGRRDQHVFELALDTHDNDERNDMLDKFERARTLRDASGSYHELDLALAGVIHHVNKPARYQWLTDNAVAALRLLDELYLPPITRFETDLDHVDRALVDLALAYIVDRMPDRIKVPPDVRANALELEAHRRRARGRGSDPRALEQRDREIRGLVRRDVPTQWIAAEFGLSVSQVNRIAGGDRDEHVA